MTTTPRGGADTPPLTPYELVFGAPFFEEDRFPQIREEAEARGVETSIPERFLLLGTVGRLLRELMPEGAGGEELERYGLLLFQAYQFWRYGRELFTLDEALARRLVESPPEVGGWELTAPHPAGYLRLPRNLFWARVDETATPEPVDGLFWSMVGIEDPMMPPHRRLDLLLVLGMRPDRPGFSTIPAASELVAAPLGHWADADARPDAPDFANILPGGELQGWHGLVTEEEVLRLVSLIFWKVVTDPAAVGEPVAPEPGGAPEPHAFPPTSLRYRVIRSEPDDG